jgi:hypothetical protein
MLLLALSVALALLLIVLALRATESNRFLGVSILLVTAGMSLILFRTYVTEIYDGWVSAKADVVSLASKAGLISPPPQRPQVAWPPVLGQPYPDLALVDQDGRRTSLSEFKGKVILVEPIGMPCRACIALAGGHECGPFDGIAPQDDLKSIEEYAREYGHVDLDDERIVVVQILFYTRDMSAAIPLDASRWARHFGMDRSKNRVVLTAEPHLVNPATHAMIPGFQLIDKDFILRYDSTGHNPRHDLYRELLPGMRKLLDEGSAAVR